MTEPGQAKGYTDDQVTKTISDIVAEIGPETSFEDGCIYRFEGEPVCLIGHLLQRLGDPGWERVESDLDLNSTRIEAPDWDGRTNLSERQRHWLNEAQIRQDAGYPWSIALERYMRERDIELGLIERSEDDDGEIRS